MTALGVSLLLIGAIVVMVEAHVPTLGALGGPGVIALGAGAILTVAGLGGGWLLGVVAALLLVAISGTVLFVSLSKGLGVRRRRVRSGAEGMIGHLGVVQSWDEPAGKVFVDGALWSARRSIGDEPEPDLHAGDRVVVERLTGLTLCVRPAEEWELIT
ncbi:MAG TPA: NfeD family protein [Solirubrobacteraceae bacterium]|jgi:membrane-bound serine protease (ClpP class)